MNKQKLVEQFQRKYGCLESIDWKNKTIYMTDGGLFSIESKKKKVNKLLGWKPVYLKNKKVTEAIFSKKKYVTDYHKVSLWFEEIDETINWFKKLKKMLIKNGYKTSYDRRKK